MALFAGWNTAHKLKKRRLQVMDPKRFNEPKELEIGEEKEKFIISKIPAIQAQQLYRKLMQEVKDDGDIAMTYLPEDAIVELLSYSARVDGEDWTALDNSNAINFTFKNVENLIELEAAMIRYNFGFLFNGGLQKVLEVLREGLVT